MEGPVTAEAGDYLCRGEKGEVWPQKTDRLLARYTATGEVDAEGWRKFQPKPDARGVWAARIDHPFHVQAPWGKLTGKAGDYVVKHFEDGDVPYPEDVWIVDQTLFAATYARVD
jgi:hypothetical protein